MGDNRSSEVLRVVLMEDQKQPLISKHMAEAASAIYLYGTLIGFLYLWSYWRFFGINFLEFASFSDVLRLSLLPILVTLIASFIGVVAGEQLPLRLEPGRGRQLIEEGNRWAIWGQRLIIPMLSLLLLLALLFLGQWKWIVIGAIVAIVLSRDIESSNLLPSIKGGNRKILAFFFVYAPFVVLYLGESHAKTVGDWDPKYGRTFQERSIVYLGGGPLVTPDSKFIGVLGEFAFFYSEDQMVIINKIDESLPLILAPNKLNTKKDRKE